MQTSSWEDEEDSLSVPPAQSPGRPPTVKSSARDEDLSDWVTIDDGSAFDSSPATPRLSEFDFEQK